MACAKPIDKHTSNSTATTAAINLFIILILLKTEPNIPTRVGYADGILAFVKTSLHFYRSPNDEILAELLSECKIGGTVFPRSQRTGCSHFFPGSSIRRSGPSPAADWFYGQTTLQF
jgi:hypothetical protein